MTLSYIKKKLKTPKILSQINVLCRFLYTIRSVYKQNVLFYSPTIIQNGMKNKFIYNSLKNMK